MAILTLAATGDSFISRRLPVGDSSAAQIASLLAPCDARFTNFEMTTPGDEGFPAAQSGGTWARADAAVVRDLKSYGFNLIAWANNHTLDYSYGGMEATRRALEANELVHAGVGDTLAEAGAVKYLECAGGRIALVAATSTFHESWIAGEQRPDMRGRPGVNPLRFVTTYRVSAERMTQLQSLAQKCGVNARRQLSQKEGFLSADDAGVWMLGPHLRFQIGDDEGEKTEPHAGDLGRVLERIREAKSQADVVLVSIHSHEMRGRKDQPAEFLTTFARQCVDEGASAIIGHGPHIVRGIEIYRGCPIFYSLGSFIFQNETVAHQPVAFYEKYGLSHSHHVGDAYDARSGGNSKGLALNPDIWRSIIPLWTMRDGRVASIALHSIELGFGLPRYAMGWPQLSEKTEVLEQLRELSRPFGTEIRIEGAVGYITLPKRP